VPNNESEQTADEENSAITLMAARITRMREVMLVAACDAEQAASYFERCGPNRSMLLDSARKLREAAK
jgi:hypothetical protein